METIQLTCAYCNTVFEKRLCDYKNSIKRRKQTKFYCSNKCVGKAQKIEKIKVYCRNCNKEIFKDPKEYRRSETKRFFCNTSCCNSFYKVKSQKAKKSKIKIDLLGSLTKKELFEKRNTYLNARSNLAEHARRIYKQSGRPYICKVCGYTHHIEICHIIPVAAFSDDTLIAEINNINNLVALCPNHHWEFDNNLLCI